MKLRAAILLPALLAVWLGDQGVADDSRPAAVAPLPSVTAVLDYSKSGDGGDDPAADAFFAELDRYAGTAIRLKLTIVPKQDPESPGYRLVRVFDTWGRLPSADLPAEILCGASVEGGMLGIVDNFATVQRLDLQHPRHFHAPTRITVGDRARFPFQSIVCSAEHHTERELTSLILEGYFVVAVADLPTARSYELFPFTD
jgi:hypothetical protein